MNNSIFKTKKSTHLKISHLKFIAVAIFLFVCFISNPIQSQVKVNFNVDAQPLWGPVGYDYANYYYMPEADVFYSVPENKFYYQKGNNWVGTNNLPANYNIDLNNTYKVVVKEPKPYLNHGYYVSNYAKYKHNAPKQIIIRESNEVKYYKVKGHPKYIKYKEVKGPSKVKKYKKVKVHSNEKEHSKKDDK